ncbi:MAG: asparagine synthetase B family protein [Kovacikia sp.]
MDTIQSAVHPPYHFVGYWGCDPEPELEALLTGLLQATQAQSVQCSGKQPRSQDRSNPSGWAWRVAYLGLAESTGKSANPPTETIAAMSASGLCHPLQSVSIPAADAWVRVQDQRLILGREPFGRVPLYWTQTGQTVWFASRFSLLLSLAKAPQINIAAGYAYSCFSYVPTPLTPIAEIFSVPAGTEQIWVCDDSGIVAAATSQRSLEWCESPTQIQNEETAIAQLQTLLKQAVDEQIWDLGEAPIGVFLSGGLDSSIVAALLVQAGLKVRAYTLDFGAVGVSEYPYAEQVAQFLNIPLVKVDVTPRRIRQALLPTAQALDLPFGDGVSVPLFLLAQAASQETWVIFNGEGGDQLFAGWTNKPLIAASLYQANHAAEESFVQHYLQTFHRLWGYENRLFQPEVSAQIQPIHPQNWLQDALCSDFSTSLLHRLRRANLMLKGAQNIHPRATALAWAHGLGVRSPFCNLSLADWVFQIAPELHLQGCCEKYILKRAVESWLPPEIVWRTKRGMGVPVTAWCLDSLWHDVGIWLNPERLRQEGIWDPQAAVRIATGEFGTIQGRRIGESLWLLLMWQVWRSAVWGQNSQASSLAHPFWLPVWLGRQYLQFCRRRQASD